MNAPTTVIIDNIIRPIISWDEFQQVLVRNGYDLNRYSIWDTFIGDAEIGDGWVVRAHQVNRTRVVYILDIEGDDY